MHLDMIKMLLLCTLVVLFCTNGFVECVSAGGIRLNETSTIQFGEDATQNIQFDPTTGTIAFESDISTDSIQERTSGLGVTIDGLLIRDGLVDSIDIATKAAEWETRLAALETTTTALEDKIIALTLESFDFNSDFSGFDLTKYQTWLSDRYSDSWNTADAPVVVEYDNGLGAGANLPVDQAYVGGVYSPVENRIWFVPAAQANVASTFYHYIDCDTGSVVTYNHALAVNPVFQAYLGGAYAPTLNRIYWAPYQQASIASKIWHYVDCDHGSIVAYNHGVALNPIVNAYDGAVYSPTQDRVYFVPHAQGDEAGKNYHYIDCRNGGTVVEYLHTLAINPMQGAYSGGVYSPSQNHIYFFPQNQAGSLNDDWHYVNCDDGEVVAYDHALATRPVTNAYWSGAYSPTNNRIYLIPTDQADQLEYHYIDCDTGLVHVYTHGLAPLPQYQGYAGGAYVPTQNRIYFAPYTQGDQAIWHYLNCDTGDVVAYNHGLVTPAVSLAYAGAVYSPTQQRVYFIPSAQADEAGNNWHFIDVDTGVAVDKDMMAAPMFNKGW